ncbi:hypothetical protein AB0L53_51440 [Nonomuraea sp. NPDC052129]|uniref:hypothetical protein n=1 Tax=Nonomuraea sp. NPDC052129 TaxID=3154651 RepID=UPI00344464F3
MSAFHGKPVRRRVVGVIAMALVPLMVAVGVAWAAATDNMFPTPVTGGLCVKGMHRGFPCQTDNSAVYYYMDSSGDFKLESVDKNMVRNALSGEYSPTRLAIHYDSTPVFTGSGETDIVYQEGSSGLNDTAAGMTWCDATGNDLLDCDQQVVRIRGNGRYTYARVCHETGHAVGLQHGDNSSPELSKTDGRLGCLVTPSTGHNDLGANNVENINATY